VNEKAYKPPAQLHFENNPAAQRFQIVTEPFGVFSQPVMPFRSGAVARPGSRP
jgi:hypothetical protein